jgi:predicted ester cyclase
MTTQTEINKAVVLRFNNDIIAKGNPASFDELMAPGFINHTAMPGISQGADGMKVVFDALHSGFPDIRVEIYDQIAEGDKVTTRKKILGTHTGNFMGITPTGQKVEINVIDIVTIRNGQYAEHWGSNNIPSVIAQLKSAQ